MGLTFLALQLSSPPLIRRVGEILQRHQRIPRVADLSNVLLGKCG